jgi:hypothetical protein
MKLMERILMEIIRILEAISPTESHRKIDHLHLYILWLLTPSSIFKFEFPESCSFPVPLHKNQNTTQQCAHNLPDDILGGAQFFE